MKTHCGKCHLQDEPEGDFSLRSLGRNPNQESIDGWVSSLEYVKLGEMPPAESSRLTTAERKRLVAFLRQKINSYHARSAKAAPVPPRRMNNREFANSLAEVLMIEDIGTHQPLANLLGDTLHHGFDTHGETLGLSEYHLEQYIEACRNVLDGTLLSGDQPPKRTYQVTPDKISMTHLSAKNKKRKRKVGKAPKYVDILDLRKHAYFTNFETAPAAGKYRIKIRVQAMDHKVYDSQDTGVYHGDPIRLRVHMGDRLRDYDLPDNKTVEIELEEWLAAGTRIQLSHLTDGLRQRGNGNFKFQFGIAHDYIKKNDPKLFKQVVESIAPKRPGRTAKPVRHWSHWEKYWEGPRPRLYGIEIEGPLYESWPPKRQVNLLGKNPKASAAEAILLPIAERAWRRSVSSDELAPIVELVQSKAKSLGDIDALKEGIVAVFVSPSFLLLNSGAGESADRFANKLGFFLTSRPPQPELRESARQGELQTFAAVRQELQRAFEESLADEFLHEFPHAWLQLDRINFMSPDPDRFPMYDRKRLSEDMVNEALRFFEHAIENNVPVPELLTANYSFVNADLAQVYGIKRVPQDSQLRKHTFKDGRRGGLLGMGAFLTLTADSQGTSPIHRAVYVMENFMGITPSPPPADVKITEPDVRQAKTIKEILAAHASDKTCASCHKSIDPYGYAFENFDPMGAWRDYYSYQGDTKPSKKKLREQRKRDKKRKAAGLPPDSEPWQKMANSIDSSAQFRSGKKYKDIIGFRKLMQAPAAKEQFVRCFVTKLLTYANGEEPDDFSAIDNIVSKSAKHEYRIIDTIAAVVDSPLFREQ